MNQGQILLAIHLKELGVLFRQQEPVCPERKWRLDFYLQDYGIGIEVDGYFAGKHGAGYGSDNEKSNTATMLGIRMLRFSTNDVKRGKAKQFMEQWLGSGGGKREEVK